MPEATLYFKSGTMIYSSDVLFGLNTKENEFMDISELEPS